MLKVVKGKAVDGHGLLIKGNASSDWRAFFIAHGATWHKQANGFHVPAKTLPKPIKALLDTQTSLDPDDAQRVMAEYPPSGPIIELDTSLQVQRDGDVVAVDNHTELKPGDIITPEDNPGKFETEPIPNPESIPGDETPIISPEFARQLDRIRTNASVNMGDKDAVAQKAWAMGMPHVHDWINEASNSEYMDALHVVGQLVTQDRKILVPKPKSAFSKAYGRVTPIRRQYLDIKANYPDALLAFRLGDFYEFFDEDAEIVSRELDLVLTGRTYGHSPTKVPMCGFPHMQKEIYFAKLTHRGYHVAVAEQVGEPTGNGPVDRKVIQVRKPGKPQPVATHEPRWWYDGQWWHPDARPYPEKKS